MTVARSTRDLVLPEDDAQAVLLVQAVEEADRTGELLTLDVRRSATARARQTNAGDDASWLAVRARDLCGQLEQEMPFLPRFRRWTNPVRGLLVPAVLVAFVLGLGTNALGPEKRVNVLALPLIGLIAWNLAMLALLAVKSWLPVGRMALRSGAPRLVERLAAMARRLIARLPRDHRDETSQARLKQALGRYLTAWLPAVTPLAAARSRRLMHACSLLLIVGVVAGMYARGIAFQYRASWESTFLQGATIDRFLGAVLSPAASLLGIPVPRAAEIESPSTGDAAPWIHLYGLTAALFVGLPRLLLVILESVRCARRRRRVTLTLADGYVRRLLASVDTSERRLEVIPYSYRPSARTVDGLKRLLFDLFGPRSEIRVLPTFDYGGEPESLEPSRGRLRAVLFGLAQTPEVEVHGEFLQHIQQELADGQALLLVVDGSAYRLKLEGGGGVDERMAERRRAWDRVARDAGLSALHVDLMQPLPDEVLTRTVAAAWPEGVLDGVLDGVLGGDT